MSYEMPSADLGEWVLFYAHEGANPVPALVSGTASRTLTLWAVAPGYGGTEKASVHHLSDPGVNEFPEWKRYGFWEHRPRDPRISQLSERVALLEKKLQAIEPKKAK